MSDTRPFDVILYGATGFTGRQTVAYFRDHAPATLRWAIAGRSAERLERLRQGLGAPQAGVVVADSERPATLEELASRTRVLLTTAGPFARYGDPVVKACVEQRTDYVDITGETPWVRRLIDTWHARAAAEGTKVIPFCGFDSIPSDLGTAAVAGWIRREWGQATRRVRASFRAGRVGLNGGTLASALLMAESGEQRALADVLLLNPPEARSEEERRRSRDWRKVVRDDALGCWLIPFFMAQVNTRVVRRTNALLAAEGQPYGPDFAYQECMESSGRGQAFGFTLALAGFEKLLKSRAARRLVQRLGPAPGEGPSEEAMERGWFRVRFLAEAADGRRALGTMKSQGDPGNRSTVRMLCESALCLALQRAELPGGEQRGGVLTPAFALGDVLLQRLLATSKMSFEVAPLG